MIAQRALHIAIVVNDADLCHVCLSPAAALIGGPVAKLDLLIDDEGATEKTGRARRIALGFRRSSPSGTRTGLQAARTWKVQRNPV